MAFLTSVFIVASIAWVQLCSGTNKYYQDVSTRYWFTAVNGSQLPPFPIDWDFIPLSSINYMVYPCSTQSDEIWLLDGLQHKIYSMSTSENQNSSDSYNFKSITISSSTDKKSNNNNKNNYNSKFNNDNDNTNILTSDAVILPFPLTTTVKNSNNNNNFSVIVANDNLWQYWNCESSVNCIIINEMNANWTQINDAIVINSSHCYLATDIGLYSIIISQDNKNENVIVSNRFIPQFIDITVTSVDYHDEKNILAFGTFDQVWRWNLSYTDSGIGIDSSGDDKKYEFKLKDPSIPNNTNFEEFHYDWTFGLIDAIPRKLKFIDDDLYVANNACINALRYLNVNDDTTSNSDVDGFELWIRIGEHQGLPYRHVIDITYCKDCFGGNNSDSSKNNGGNIWIAHNNGALSRILLNPTCDNNGDTSGNSNDCVADTDFGGTWRYYQGNRWLTS